MLAGFADYEWWRGCWGRSGIGHSTGEPLLEPRVARYCFDLRTMGGSAALNCGFGDARWRLDTAVALLLCSLCVADSSGGGGSASWRFLAWVGAACAENLGFRWNRPVGLLHLRSTAGPIGLGLPR